MENKHPKQTTSIRFKARFPLGFIAATPGVEATLSPADIPQALARHAAGDWGDVCPEYARENALSLARGFRLYSVYIFDPSRPDEKLWIITEADRSSTCVLLPADY